MVRTSDIAVRVTMRGQRTFAGQIKKTTAELEAMGVKGASAMGKIASAGAKMQALGASMTRKFSLPVAVGLGYATKTAIDFSGSMERLTTQAGATQRQTDALSKSIVDFSTSGKTAFGPQALSEAAFHAVSQGFHNAADAMNVLTAAADGAEIGGADLVDTTKVLGQTMKAFDIPASQARKTMSQFNTIVGHGDMTMQDLVTGMQTGVVPIFAQANLSLDDLGGAMDLLTSRTFTATKAGTGLKMAISAILAPSDKAQGIMKKLGIDSDTLATTLQTKGLPAAIGYLNQQIKDTGLSSKQVAPMLLSAFGGGRTGPAVLTLIQHLSELRKNVNAARPDIDAFDKAVAAWAETPAGKLEKAKAQLEGTAILIGMQLAPVVASLATHLSALFGWFSKLPAPMRDMAVQGLVIVAALGPLVWMLGTIQKSFYYLMVLMRTVPAVFGAARVAVLVLGSAFVGLDIAALAIPAAIVAVTAGLVILYLKVKWFRDKVNAVFNFFKDHPFAAMLIPGIGPFVTASILIIKHFGAIKQAAQDTFGWIKNAAGNIGDWFSGAWSAVANGIGAAFTTVKQAVVDALNFIIDKINGTIHAFNALPGPDIGYIKNISEPLTAADRRAFRRVRQHPGTRGTPFDLYPGSLHRRAMGGPVLPGGTALVGERGPELVQFPFGGQVMSTDQTRQLLASQKNAPTIVIPVHLNGRVIAEEVVRAGQTARARR